MIYYICARQTPAYAPGDAYVVTEALTVIREKEKTFYMSLGKRGDT